MELEEVQVYVDARIMRNCDLDRIEIHCDGPPTTGWNALIASLQSYGWQYSTSPMVWCHDDTEGAMDSANGILRTYYAWRSLDQKPGVQCVLGD